MDLASVPQPEDELRVSALAETVHYSTLIEGNELPIIEAERAARPDDADTKAKIKIVNWSRPCTTSTGWPSAAES